MVSYGFYDSISGDRRYNAKQFTSIFDGIIRDGIFMSIEDCLRVRPSTNMNVTVGPGRAWFNHSWTLNDAKLPITIPTSDPVLNRIDAIVLDINQNKSVRKNDIILVKGTAAATPSNPTLINDEKRHQYPLAYITVNARASSIHAADITSMIGTSQTPYVTGILETVSIDALIDQWKDQFSLFLNGVNTEWDGMQEQWSSFLNESSSEWDQWKNEYTDMMNDTADMWKALWSEWFYSYTNNKQQSMEEWQENQKNEYENWYNSLTEMLTGNVAANLSAAILDIQKKMDEFERFKNDLEIEYSVYSSLLDSNGNTITDSNLDPIKGHVIFITK